MNLDFEEIIVVSVNKNYNIDYLLKRIKFYQTSRMCMLLVIQMLERVV